MRIDEEIASDAKRPRNDRLTEWRCVNGHVMGMAGWDGRGVSVLLLFREAQPPSVSPLNGEEDEVEVMAVVEGASDVRCSVCGEVRSWFVDERLVRKLIRNARRF